jgi:hypothetical protein
LILNSVRPAELQSATGNLGAREGECEPARMAAGVELARNCAPAQLAVNNSQWLDRLSRWRSLGAFCFPLLLSKSSGRSGK